ncbi:MAG: DUF262 domain-containing protein [Pyrinomonadaceae bacterium]|nr:DUF262 domain-containing protein [Pyrinomonadaceae bacterium]
MINATKEQLNSFFSGTLQFVVPFFQRAYVWDSENWEILWDHISRIANVENNTTSSEHFIGTLIIKQRLANKMGEHKHDLIDGQQRLTTFALLLKAIANTASGNEPYTKLIEKTNELIVFEDAKGTSFIRLEHSKNDIEYFEAIMLDKDVDRLPNQDHRILKCYRFFEKKLEGYTDEQLDTFKTVILNNVPLISMLLSANDDEQEIFDTINSLGVRLTTGELLKNFIFSDTSIRVKYSELWEPVFEDDEDQINFWNRSKTSGRVVRTNIEVLLYCYLIIQKKANVELERLFKEYKAWLGGKSDQEKIDFLEELKDYASIYFTFPEGTQLNELRFSQHEERFFHVIEKLEITTVYPLVLYLYKRVGNRSHLVEMLGTLESYLVRRQVCRLSTKNYNNVFIQMIKELESLEHLTPESFRSMFESFDVDTNRFPLDIEFTDAFLKQPISNINAREILFCISLYQIHTPMNDVGSLSSSSYTVEHIMPQKWEEHWSVAGMDDLARLERNRKIKTLGNLTLVTQYLNSSMKNAPWETKREALQNYSLLKITTEYLEKISWDESEIESRALDLARTALKIWR